MRALVIAMAALTLSACQATAPAPPTAPAMIETADMGRFVEIERIAADGLPDQRLSIWLPPGYDSNTATRYPVLYMHDGHNLFDVKKSNFNKIWAADKAVLTLMAKGTIRPHIIVGIWAPSKDRYRQYLPRPAYDAASGDVRAAMDDMTGGEVVSDRYLAWMADTLKPMIDAEYRTLTGAKDTAIAGSSMGGLMSCYAFVTRPDVFGRAACVSSHWPAADPAKVGDFNQELAAIWQTTFVERLGNPNGRRLWMDIGTATLDAYYPPYQARIDDGVLAAGWRKGVDFESKVYDGAPHEENAWAARLPEILGWLLKD